MVCEVALLPIGTSLLDQFVEILAGAAVALFLCFLIPLFLVGLLADDLCDRRVSREACSLLPLVFVVGHIDTSCVQEKAGKPAPPPYTLEFTINFLIPYLC